MLRLVGSCLLKCLLTCCTRALSHIFIAITAVVILTTVVSNITMYINCGKNVVWHPHRQNTTTSIAHHHPHATFCIMHAGKAVTTYINGGVHVKPYNQGFWQSCVCTTKEKRKNKNRQEKQDGGLGQDARAAYTS